MLRLHRGHIQYEMGYQVLFFSRSPPPGEKIMCSFQGWSRVFVASASAALSKDNPTRKRGNLFDENVLSNEGASYSKPKLKIVHSRKHLGVSILAKKTTLLIQRT